MATDLPYVFTKDPHPLTFNYTLSEAGVFYSNSKITWILTHNNILSPIILSFNLTENTLDKNVLVVFEISIAKRELIPDEFREKVNSTFPKISVEMINNMDKMLQEDPSGIYQYESKIINHPVEKIWEMILNFDKIMKEKGIIRNFTSPGEIKKEGDVLSFESCSSGKFCKLKILKMRSDLKKKQWEINFLPMEGPFRDIENDWHFIKLSDRETLVCNVNKYSEHIEPKILKELTSNKIRVFQEIEKELNNRSNIDNNNIKG